MANLIGQSLGRYHILEQLGEGGMATVYKAFDTRLETDVAVKVIRTEKLTEETRERALKRFEREAKALARLTHPNIVKVTDFGEYQGKPYLVMPYLSGGTLKERLGKPVPWQDAFRMLAPIARALEYAHQRDVIHRDVKASNILITDSGQPMISDFGIAKILTLDETVDLTGTGMGIGTPEYMAPEQWNGKTTPQSDQYSLGIVLYEMLTGRKPYTAETPAAILLKQATEPLPRPSRYAPDLPEAVEKILIKALGRDLKDRYADMGGFASALEKLASGGSQSQLVVAQKKSSMLRFSSVATILALIMGGLILLALIAFFVINQYTRSNMPHTGSGNVVTTAREIRDFHGITVEYLAEIVIKQGSAESIKIEAEDNVIEDLRTDVKDGILTIDRVDDSERWVRPTKPVRITIVVKELDEFNFDSTGTVEIDSLKSDSLDLNVNGPGTLILNKVQFKTLNCKLDGAGTLTLSGTVDNLNVDMSGFGSFQADDLHTQIADVSIDGAGGATVWVEKSLTARISGAGSICYYGSPTVAKIVDGVGSITSLGKK
jgi:serine/threonine protein kinase